MAPDDAADLLADLPDDRRQHFIAMMEKDDAEDMRELLSYPEHSAGGIMTTEFAWARLDDTAAEAMERLREQAEYVETVYYIYVVDRSEHLRGVFSLRDLLTTPPEKKVRDFMTENPVSVRTDASEEEITRRDRQVQPARPARRRRGGRAARHHHHRRRHRPGAAAGLEEAPAEDLPLRRPRPGAVPAQRRPPARRPHRPHPAAHHPQPWSGPGLIAANADNDAGGITTWSVIGSRYGYSMLWLLVLITPVLADRAGDERPRRRRDRHAAWRP